MRVLLVPSNFHSAEGVIARYVAQNCKGIESYFFSANDISQRPDEFLKLVKQADVIHWIMNLCNVPDLDSFDWNGFSCASVASVHHIAPGEDQKISFAQKANLIHVESKMWLHTILSQVSTPVSLALGGVDYLKLSKLQNIQRPRKVFSFGMFGASYARKRAVFFRDALLQMKLRNFQVVFQGFDWEKEIKMFQNSGISVRFLGHRPFSESWKGYGEIDCYVCSSNIEGGPLGILEALSGGVPVVSTAVGIAPEVLFQGGGTVIGIDDLTGFSRALKQMIEDKSYYKKCVKETSGIAERYFKTTADDYYKMYCRAIQIKQGNETKSQILKKQSSGNFLIQRERELAKDLILEALIFFKDGRILTGFSLWVKGFSSCGLNFFWALKMLKFGVGEFVRRLLSFRGKC